MSNAIKIIHSNAGGVDIGSESVFVGLENQAVTSYGTFTSEFRILIKHLQSKGITTVAMEATGVYWYALYEMLEEAGIEVYLVNGAHMKNVPGRKSDVQDCQWLQQLHSYGLLRKSFIPPEHIRQLRTYTRLREDHIEMSASHIQHMQKALTSMNIRIHQQISQITGISGMKIVKAILSGERNSKTLLSLCSKQIINKKADEVILSLEGNYKAEHLFALKQAVEGYEFYLGQIEACERQIELLIQQINDHLPPPEDCPTLNSPRPARHHQPNIDGLHTLLVTATGGKDAAQISGFTDKTFLKIIGEVGTNVDAWPTAQHFTSWLGLTPKTDQTGKSKKRRKNRAKTKGGQIFKEAVMGVAESKYLALGGFYRRIRAKRGAAIAVMATARKLAVQYYNLMKYGVNYVEQGIEKYEEMQKNRLEQFLIKKSQELGFQLVNIETGEVVH
jgi:transposase